MIFFIPRRSRPPPQTKVESVYNEMDCATPVIYLLSAGADPTDSIEVLARKKKTDVACVSMGEVIFSSMIYQEPHIFLHRVL